MKKMSTSVENLELNKSAKQNLISAPGIREAPQTAEEDSDITVASLHKLHHQNQREKRCRKIKRTKKIRLTRKTRQS